LSVDVLSADPEHPPVDPVDQFAENLRAARRRRGLSQEALAAAADLHRTEVSLLERGGREPRLTTIVRLARALDTSPGRLLAKID
jgi:transcriptional regulator with XRE-family HTH domain